MPRTREIPHRGDVPERVVAQLLGLTEAEFRAKRGELARRRFPEPDPTTGLYCIEAVDRWRLLRNQHLFSELTPKAEARDASTIDVAERLKRGYEARRGDPLSRRA